MKLHHDQILKCDPSRQRMIDIMLAARKVNPYLSFDMMGYGLEQKMGYMPAGAIATTLMTLHQEQGQQTFVLGPHMTSMLEHTSVQDVARDDLHLPYPIFYVVLTDCGHRLWGGGRTQWHKVSGMYVHMVEDTRALTILAWAEENERSLGPGDDAQSWARLHLRAHIHEDLETSIDSLLRDDKNDKSDPIIDPFDEINGTKYPDDGREAQTATLRAMFRIAINLALYLSSEGADAASVDDEQAAKLKRKIESTKSPGKRKKYERQLSQRSKATFIKVGRSIEERARTQVREHGNVRAHWVRGHWHHYWTGKGRATKVRKWVMPYPKGLDTPEKRTYEVERT